MWNAIKSDLFEFVAQVQEDAQETLSKVVDLNTGRNHDDEEKISEEERILADFRNNFDTYSEDVEPEQLPEFQKFVQSFSLSSKADEIEYILEEEDGVTKHYEALVPAHLTPDLFWARYFFKVNILIISSLDSVLESALDDEEELTWGEDEEEGEDRQQKDDRSPNTPAATPHQSAPPPPTIERDTHTVNCKNNSTRDEEDATSIASSNASKLQATVDTLSARAETLEREVEKLQDQLIQERTLSAKLRSQVAQGVERETNMAVQVGDLRHRLQALEAEKITWAEQHAGGAADRSRRLCAEDDSPPRNDSGIGSIVDLGGDVVVQQQQQHKQQQQQGTGSRNEKSSTKGDLGLSISDLSLASLQSATSSSRSSSLSSPTEAAAALSEVPARQQPSLSATKKGAADTKEKKGAGAGAGTGGRAGAGAADDEEEEEWDNDAWE